MSETPTTSHPFFLRYASSERAPSVSIDYTKSNSSTIALRPGDEKEELFELSPYLAKLYYDIGPLEHFGLVKGILVRLREDHPLYSGASRLPRKAVVVSPPSLPPDDQLMMFASEDSNCKIYRPGRLFTMRAQQALKAYTALNR